MTMTVYNEKETENAGEELGKTLKNGDVVWLFGPMGAGKTAFVRGLAKGLGIIAQVSSPTYAIVQEYGGRLELFHFDLYRLNGWDDLFDIGWEEYLDRGGVCAVEWSERLGGRLKGVNVRIEPVSENGRRIEYEYISD